MDSQLQPVNSDLVKKFLVKEFLVKEFLLETEECHFQITFRIFAPKS